MERTTKTRLGRIPLIVVGIACLVGGVWGGLVRLPLNLPLPGGNANWLTFHGPLMVCGFLGTVVALERAVGLGKWWTYAAPMLTGAGAVMFLAGGLGRIPLYLILAGSVVFWTVTLQVVRLQRALFTTLMSAGAFSWVAGNILWAADWPFPRVAPWWIAFLALTIIGERLDLSRFQRQSRWSRPTLAIALSAFGVGLVLTSIHQVAGECIMGLGILACGAWLFRFDIARRSLKQHGLPLFMGLWLLVGFGWLCAAGLLMIWASPLSSGWLYDAALHSFFVGFVVSMIFAHAPIIFPAVLVLQPRFNPRFHLHAVVLQAGLLLRVMGDLTHWLPGKRVGAIISAVALLMFLVNTVSSFVTRQPESGLTGALQPAPSR